MELAVGVGRQSVEDLLDVDSAPFAVPERPDGPITEVSVEIGAVE